MTIRLRSVISVLGLTAPLLLSGSFLAVSSTASATSAPVPHVVDVHVPGPALRVPALARPAVRHAAPRPVVTRPTAVTRAAVRPAVRPTVRRLAAPAPARPVTRPAARPAAPAAPAPRPAATQPATQPAPRPTAAPAPRTSGDDYPYRTDTTGGHDRWGFTMRQCVSFAAWRLAQHGHALDNDTQHWGSALDWDDVARARGVAISSTPRVGAVAQWNAGESSKVAGGTFTAGSYGHVGWVAGITSDGYALVEQYNLGGSRSYSTLKMKAPRYLLMG